LTKHIPDETFLKNQIELEEARRISANVTEIMDKNALAICATHRHTIMKRDTKPKVTITPVKAKIGMVKTKLGKITHKLYDLEPESATDKNLNVDLDVQLYQMENW
jgi:hypothetical protein